MTTLGKEYVHLDGMFLREEQVIKLALGAGNYAQAEHYLFALTVHAAVYGMPELVDKVNEVRNHYGVPAIPTPKNDVAGMIGSRKGDTVDDKARKTYLLMDDKERQQVLREGLRQLRAQHHLFKHAIHWLGVYLVIRDRLEGEYLTMRGFIAYAKTIMPQEWPVSLQMTTSTYKNMGRMIRSEDRGEAYYDMEENPQQEICNTYWELVKQLLIYDTNTTF